MQPSARQYTDGPTVQQFGSRLAMDQGVHPSRSKVDRAKELAQKRRWPQVAPRLLKILLLGAPMMPWGPFWGASETATETAKDSQILLAHLAVLQEEHVTANHGDPKDGHSLGVAHKDSWAKEMRRFSLFKGKKTLRIS